MINQIVAILIQFLFVLLIAPFAMGLVRFIKARLQGRHGASPFLPYFTIFTLLKKEMVISEASSWIFRLVPYAVLLSSMLLVFVVPLLFTGMASSSLSDFLVVAGILVIGAIFLVMGGLDTGSAFGGMGSSREMTITALIEPVIIMAFSAMSFATGSSTIDGMLVSHVNFLAPHSLFFIIALIFISLAENTRYPVDNPATHLELTMVHEAMILEYSGKYLAFLEYASAIKLTVFSVLIANFVFPSSVFGISDFGILSVCLAVVLVLIKVIVVMVLLALLESMIVKMRFYRMSEYFSIAFVVSFLAMVVALLSSLTDVKLEYYVLFSLLIIIFVVLLFGRVRLKAILRYYSYSSLALAGIAWGLMPFVEAEEKGHLWLFAIFTVIAKVWAVPYLINRIGQVKKSLTNLPSFLRPGKSYFVAIVLLIITYFSLKNIAIFGLVKWNALLYASATLVVLGIAMMILKRNIFSQIIGLLVIENGIAIFVLATLGSLPIVIEFGIFAVTLATAYILAMLSARIGELHGSSDTDILRKLIE